MPIWFDAGHDDGPADTDCCLRIGLVNNMGDEALRATERQFAALLSAASEGIAIQLRFYSLPEIPRTPALARHMQSHYTGIDRLWSDRLDGLIVTGREPLAARLVDEDYWPSFTRLLAWARDNTHSTLWSCLAAHAAVQHMDRIERVRRKEKLFGIFDCQLISEHPLLMRTPPIVRMPHSRWNGLPEERLLDCGYEVLTRGAQAGVDMFIKQEGALFVFFQGHPEYAGDTLLREYRRDLGRYVRGESDTCPLNPLQYFDAEVVAKLATLQAQAALTRDRSSLVEIAAIVEACTIQNTWQASAAQIYRNWLTYLVARKRETTAPSQIAVAPVLEPVS